MKRGSSLANKSNTGGTTGVVSPAAASAMDGGNGSLATSPDERHRHGRGQSYNMFRPHVLLRRSRQRRRRSTGTSRRSSSSNDDWGSDDDDDGKDHTRYYDRKRREQRLVLYGTMISAIALTFLLFVYTPPSSNNQESGGAVQRRLFMGLLRYNPSSSSSSSSKSSTWVLPSPPHPHHQRSLSVAGSSYEDLLPTMKHVFVDKRHLPLPPSKAALLLPLKKREEDGSNDGDDDGAEEGDDNTSGDDNNKQSTTTTANNNNNNVVQQLPEDYVQTTMKRVNDYQFKKWHKKTKRQFRTHTAYEHQPWVQYAPPDVDDDVEVVGVEDVGNGGTRGGGVRERIGGGGSGGPLVDYTKHPYKSPSFINGPPPPDYPPLETLGKILKRWPQDDIDHPPSPIFEEVLQIFDYMNPQEMEIATMYRNMELPFKIKNIPEINDATKKWTDGYLRRMFDHKLGKKEGYKAMSGSCGQSENNFFPFFSTKHWDVTTQGSPPTLDNDWSFALWANHAKYADYVGLAPDATHYYYQSGVDSDERYEEDESDWTFVTKDLPSFSVTEPNFFVFQPEYQKGIQCRFGERGVTAATHYDAGRNMVAMVTGAKRYILAPPNQCHKLGVINRRGHSSFRHSMLNFANMNLLPSMRNTSSSSMDNAGLDDGMSEEEREWLEISKTSLAIDTIVRAGEILYIPSHWFHYITSLQKSAQCNVRSGRDEEGNAKFGGLRDVEQCVAPSSG